MAQYDLIILDFDGTFTDVEKEAGPFFAAYQKEVRERYGNVDDEWQRALETLAKDPAHYGWTYEGRVVAPGNADPYLRATVIMNMIFDERGLLPDARERTRALSELYVNNYPKADTVFRPEAKQVVEALLDSGLPIFVVTNSATHDVEAKLDVLAPKGRERLTVHGNAKKYLVSEPKQSSERFDSVPETMSVDGLRRPVLLRRGAYYTLLERLWAETGANAKSTFIAGDIFELDLAMPATLGCAVHLVLKERTEEFEKNAVQQVGGHYSDGLGAILERAL
ncbi:MAG: HAD family hydrolase [Myxococcota bacterium]